MPLEFTGTVLHSETNPIGNAGPQNRPICQPPSRGIFRDPVGTSIDTEEQGSTSARLVTYVLVKNHCMYPAAFREARANIPTTIGFSFSHVISRTFLDVGRGF
jgi:hypothetical protein